MSSDQFGYCFAHGMVNVLRDFMLFFQNSGAKEFTSTVRHENKDVFPDLPGSGRLPWQAASLKITHFEEMLQHALVPVDVADGRVKSPFKWAADARPEMQKGVKFAHLMMYIGEFGKFALEYAAPCSPQRAFAFKLMDYMARGLARKFSREELQSLHNKGRALDRSMQTIFPSHMNTIVVHMMTHHLSWHITQFGPLSQNWTMFLERHLRTMKNSTNVNGRTVTRIALADFRQRKVHDSTPCSNLVPSYLPTHPTGVADTPATKWVPRRPLARNWDTIKELCRAEYNQHDIDAALDSICFAEVLEVRGRLYRSRAWELTRDKKNCNSVALINWGLHDDIGRATTCCLKGFYRVNIAGTIVYFVSIRTVTPLEHKHNFSYVKKIDINSSPSEAAKRGEIVRLSQLNTSCVLVCLPELVIVPQRRGNPKVSVSNRNYWVIPVRS